MKRTNLYSVLLRLYLWYLDNKRLKRCTLMVNLSEYKDYCTDLLKLIGADELVMVVQEEHLKRG
ncbi:MAG: hypothetical protein ACLU4N_03475 [Butyricimonas faecihominis]